MLINKNTTEMTRENLKEILTVREKKEITEGIKSSYLIINHKAIIKLARALEYFGSNKLKTNHYIGVNGSNICLVKVADDGNYGAYCVVNKTVTNNKGEKINLVEELKKYSFYVNSNGLRTARFKTRTSRNELTKELNFNKGVVNIGEIIFTLITGKITGASTGLEIHHESSVFDHRVECCEQLTKEEHVEKSRKSRRNGVVINNMNELIYILRRLESINNLKIAN